MSIIISNINLYDDKGKSSSDPLIITDIRDVEALTRPNGIWRFPCGVYYYKETGLYINKLVMAIQLGMNSYNYNPYINSIEPSGSDTPLSSQFHSEMTEIINFVISNNNKLHDSITYINNSSRIWRFPCDVYNYKYIDVMYDIRPYIYPTEIRQVYDNKLRMYISPTTRYYKTLMSMIKFLKNNMNCRINIIKKPNFVVVS